MSERLSDEQVALTARFDNKFGILAREVQDLRAVLFGGPCPTCGGDGHLGPATNSPQRDYGRACPACVDGRVPGVIERLDVIQSVCVARDQRGFSAFPDGLAAVITALKEATA